MEHVRTAMIDYTTVHTNITVQHVNFNFVRCTVGTANTRMHGMWSI